MRFITDCETYSKQLIADIESILQPMPFMYRSCDDELANLQENPADVKILTKLMSEIRIAFQRSNSTALNTVLQSTALQRVFFKNHQYLFDGTEDTLSACVNAIKDLSAKFAHHTPVIRRHLQQSCEATRQCRVLLSKAAVSNPAVTDLHAQIINTASADQIIALSTFKLNALLTKTSLNIIIDRMEDDDLPSVFHALNLPAGQAMQFLMLLEKTERFAAFEKCLKVHAFSSAQRQKCASMLKTPTAKNLLLASEDNACFLRIEELVERRRSVKLSTPAWIKDLSNAINDLTARAFDSSAQKYILDYMRSLEKNAQMSVLSQLTSDIYTLLDFFRDLHHNSTIGRVLKNSLDTQQKVISAEEFRSVLQRTAHTFSQEEINEMFMLSAELPAHQRVLFDIYLKPDVIFTKYSPLALSDILDSLIEDSECTTRLEALKHFLPAHETVYTKRALDGFSIQYSSASYLSQDLRDDLYAESFGLAHIFDSTKSTSRQDFAGIFGQGSFTDTRNSKYADTLTLQNLKALEVSLPEFFLSLQQPSIMNALEQGILTSKTQLNALLEPKPSHSRSRI